MAGSQQMRAAWSRRTDHELLHAYFLEELSPDGRALVSELVVEKLGSIEAYLETFARAQGDVIATIAVRNCEIDAAVKEQRLPVMWGYLVLAAHGIGFIPGGVDEGAGDFGLGGIAGALATSLIATIDRARNIVDHSSTPPIPLPLLAELEPGAMWLPRAAFDEVLWGPDFGEVMRAGERLCCLEPSAESEEIVATWAEAHGIALVGLDAAPLLR